MPRMPGASERRAGAGPPPRLAVAKECARALGAGLLLPLRAAAFLPTRARRLAELRGDLAAPRATDEPPAFTPPADRPLSVFVSCAEASGELHAKSLVEALRAELAAAGAPEPRFCGLGGERLREAGVETVGDPVARAAMGAAAARGVGFYVRLLTGVASRFRAEPPDLCIPVDSPALHVPLGHLAHAYGVPVVHFVTPQYWGWAPWRVASYRRAVDLALTILPFEPAWFERNGVPTAHVGHPLLDALEGVDDGRAPEESRTLALLPGSRASVVDQNLPWMLTVAARLRLSLLDVDVVLPHDRPELSARIRGHLKNAGADWVRLETGDFHGSLARAHAALTVSGTVLLDLLHHRLPAVVVYRLGGGLSTWLAHRFLTVPWFSSVNLLAGEEVYPEFGFHGGGPREAVAAALVRAFEDAEWRARCRRGLDEAARRLGPPGAARRAARHALARLAEGSA